MLEMRIQKFKVGAPRGGGRGGVSLLHDSSFDFINL